MTPAVLRPKVPTKARYFDDAALSPVANLLIIAFATCAAILSVPSDVQPAGALQPSAAWMIFGMVLGIFLRIWHRPAAAFDPVNVVAASQIYWLLLDPLQGAYEMLNISAVDVRGAFLAIGLFSSGVWLAALHRPWTLPDFVSLAATIRVSSLALFSISTAAFILSFLRFAVPSRFDLPRMWEALFSARFSAPWSRGMLGGWDAFLDHLGYFGYLLPTLAVLLGRSAGWLNVRTLAVFGYAIVIGVLLSAEGGRRIIGVMVGSAFVVWFLSQRQPNFKHLLIFAGFVAVLLWFMQVMLTYRNVGVAWAFDSVKDEEIRTWNYLHVDDNFLRTCEIIHIIPQEHEHVTWRWLLWVAVRPVPRVFWPGKPLDPGFSLHEYHGLQNTSLTMSLTGELYMAFGFVGCLVGGWLWGRMALALREIIGDASKAGSLVLYGSGLLALFAGMRSGIDFILMSYVSLAWIALVLGSHKLRGG